MSTFTFSPSYSVSQTVTPRVKSIQFGDGYMQRVADGINTQPRQWSLVFNGNEAEITAIENFLIAENGVSSFTWTPPTGAQGNFICQSWSRTFSDFNNESLSATFVEVFGA